RLKADWRERPQDLLEGVAEQVVGRDRICRESLILQCARRFTYSRKPAFDLSDIVRRSGTVITGARPVSARPLDLLGRAEESSSNAALGRAEGASLTAKARTEPSSMLADQDFITMAQAQASQVRVAGIRLPRDFFHLSAHSLTDLRNYE